jgi:hypothetical protein
VKDFEEFFQELSEKNNTEVKTEFEKNKDQEKNASRMADILINRSNNKDRGTPFEYELLGNPEQVRQVIDAAKRFDYASEQDLTPAQKNRLKSLEDSEMDYKEEKEYNMLLAKKKTSILKSRLVKLLTKMKSIEPTLQKLLDGEKPPKQEMFHYDTIVGEIEDILFDETYVKNVLPYNKGESNPEAVVESFINNIPIRFESQGQMYYGIIRPPTGIITWIGPEARKVWLDDDEVKFIQTKFPHINKSEILKIRLEDNKVEDEPLNSALLSMRNHSGSPRLIIKDDDETVKQLHDFIFRDEAELHVAKKHDIGSLLSADTQFSKEGKFKDPEGISARKVSASLNQRGRAKGIIDVFNSVEFWRFIRDLF